MSSVYRLMTDKKRIQIMQSIIDNQTQIIANLEKQKMLILQKSIDDLETLGKIFD